MNKALTRGWTPFRSKSEHKFMATLHKTAGGPEILLVKGAPEVILDHCDRQQTVAGATSVAIARPFHGGL